MVQEVRLMIFSQHMVYYHMSFLLFYAWNSNLFDVFCPIVINWVTGKIIVILHVDQIVPEDSLIKLKIGDGEHWWFPVHLGPQMFQYYRHGWYIRGRQFKILESYMQDDTLVIVSDHSIYLQIWTLYFSSDEYDSLQPQLYHPQWTPHDDTSDIKGTFPRT